MPPPLSTRPLQAADASRHGVAARVSGPAPGLAPGRAPRRRQLLLGAAACGVAGPALPGCSATDEAQAAAVALRAARPLPSWPLPSPDVLSPDLGRALVHWATLAPSSHNTQCWRFRLHGQAIDVAPDLARRCPVVDPDDHHLQVSLGCAVENLAQAALAAGLQAQVQAGPAGAIRVTLERTRAVLSPLAQAMALRQCTRGDYDGTPVSAQDLRLLEQAGSGQGVRVLLLTSRPVMAQVADLVVAGNTAQMNDPAFMAELVSWIRFSAAEARASGDGLYSATSGAPVLPRWLARPMMGLFFTTDAENERYVRQVRNASGLAVFVSEQDDPAHRVEAGRCCQRFALQATVLGLRHAFLNQPVEVAALRPQLARVLGLAPGRGRIDLVLRFGRGPAMPMSMRRPLSAVLD